MMLLEPPQSGMQRQSLLIYYISNLVMVGVKFDVGCFDQLNIGFPGDLLPVHHTEAMKHVTTPMEMGIGLIRFVNGVVTNDTN